MAKILFKALSFLKIRAFYIFLAGLFALAVCLQENNSVRDISAANIENETEAESIQYETAENNEASAAIAPARSPDKELPFKRLSFLFDNEDVALKLYESTEDSENISEKPEEESIRETETEQTESAEKEDTYYTEDNAEEPGETEIIITAAETEMEPAETQPADTVEETEPAIQEPPFEGNYGQRSQYQWETDYANQLFDLVNQLRAENGIGALKKLDALTAAANQRAWECTVSYSHTRPDGTSCFTALTENGLVLAQRAENISRGLSSPQAALNNFMSDYAHLEPMINPNFEYMGIGFYFIENDPYGGNYYWVQIFYNP